MDEMTRKIAEMVLDGIAALDLRGYGYCAECAVEVDTFVLSTSETAPHYCDICGYEVVNVA